MTQALKDLWKKNFPAWPDALIEKFKNEIEIESAMYSEKFGQETKSTFNAILLDGDFRKWTNQIIQSRTQIQKIILNPTNEKYLVSESVDTGFFMYWPTAVPDNSKYPHPGEFWESGLTKEYAAAGSVFGKIFWDSRLFSKNIGLNWEIDYDKDGEHRFQIGFGWSVLATPAKPYIHFNFLTQANAYKASESLIALSENGIELDGIDYARLKEFYDYFLAYKNFSQQINASADVSKKTAAADLQNYKADLDSKLLAQKNALQNLTLQLTTQTQGQADSVRRDMQQLNLQAVGLKLQILGLMKK